VIPAAVYGTRLLPATKGVKKEFFPLVNRDGSIKPIIQVIIEEAVESGIDEVCVIVQPGGDEHLRRYFCDPLEYARTMALMAGLVKGENG